MTNDSAFIVDEYFNKRALAQLGYTFDSNELDQWEVTAYKLIENELNKKR